MDNVYGDIKVHSVEKHILGTLAPLPEYKLGDYVSYGGAMYVPAVPIEKEMRERDLCSGSCAMVFMDAAGQFHQASVNCFKNGWHFYCS